MPKISLLIFDEAHHAKKNHPYSRIMEHFYARNADSPRPRIFGMTASPIDGKEDVLHAASDLETVLDSRIATTQNMTFGEGFTKPEEHVLRYARPTAPGMTDLCLTLESKFGQSSFLAELLLKAHQIDEQLGHWCSDLYWAMALDDRNIAGLERMVTKGVGKTAKVDKVLDTELTYIREAQKLVAAHTRELPRHSTADISPKVQALYTQLEAFFARPSDHRALIFVDQRHTATLLVRAFEVIGLPHLRPGILVGSGKSTNLADIRVSVKEQILTIIKFRKGEYNCLFATSVAEEGLDIPDCNLIIRFDLCQSMIKYVQSRGRARHKRSKFIHMIQAGDPEQEQAIRELLQAESLMKTFCGALPSDRHLQGNDDELDARDMEKLKRKVYALPNTGAKLTSDASMAVLANFISSLPDEEDEILAARYIVTGGANGFQAEVILPPQSPIRGCTGDLARRKVLARYSAAFRTCIRLHENGYLDDNLLSTYSKRVPKMRNAALALNMDSTGQYPMLMKPSTWTDGCGKAVSLLYGTVIWPSELDGDFQPMILLTRQVLPKLPDFPLYLRNGSVSTVTTHNFVRPFEPSKDELERVTRFTLRVFQDVFSKKFEHDPTALCYWFVPLQLCDRRELVNATSDAEISSKIDWDYLTDEKTGDGWRWSPAIQPTELVDRFIIDPFHGGKKYFSTRLAPEHRPVDPVPAETALTGQRLKYKDNIAESSSSQFGSSRAARTLDLEQPVFQAEKVLHRLNMLASPSLEEQMALTKCFLCPETLAISALTPNVVTTCLILPAVIHRIESYLIAIQLCEKLGLSVHPARALEAITKDSDNSGDHQTQERINFQSGMGRNYERLEFLGDCFLKMATSIAVFIQNPNDDEEDFHVKRMLLLCNQNLYNVALGKDIAPYIRSLAFSRRTWYPHGLKLLEGKKINNETIVRSLGQKTIADVCEALMGAAFDSHYSGTAVGGAWTPETWKNAVWAVTQLVSSDEHRMIEWSDYSKAYQVPRYQLEEPSASHKALAESVETQHPYHFRYPRLLRSAFLHPSYPFAWEKVPNYQRLEFLGDSLLDMACVTHLFYGRGNEDPQWLTEHKMAMVANQFLGAVCVRLGFHRHLRHNTSFLGHRIREYAMEMEEAERTSGGAMDYWVTVNEPPKCLADMVEAYIGALFIDSDFDYSEVERFFDMHIKPFFMDMTIYDEFASKHPITRLHTTLAEHYGCSDYSLMVDELPTGTNSKPDVVAGLIIHSTVIGHSQSKSPRYTKMRSAVQAMEELEGLTVGEFRAKFRCNCKGSGAAEGI